MLANLICVVSYIWQARAASYGSLMGGRILNGVGACLIESIGPMMVDDLFFVHQRGTFFGLYMCVLFAASGFG